MIGGRHGVGGHRVPRHLVSENPPAEQLLNERGFKLHGPSVALAEEQRIDLGTRVGAVARGRQMSSARRGRVLNGSDHPVDVARLDPLEQRIDLRVAVARGERVAGRRLRQILGGRQHEEALVRPGDRGDRGANGIDADREIDEPPAEEGKAPAERRSNRLAYGERDVEVGSRGLLWVCSGDRIEAALGRGEAGCQLRCPPADAGEACLKVGGVRVQQRLDQRVDLRVRRAAVRRDRRPFGLGCCAGGRRLRGRRRRGRGRRRRRALIVVPEAAGGEQSERGE